MSEKTKATLFEQVGGRDILEKVHKIFYDKLYEHPWLGPYFKTVPQNVIEEQQTDFMTAHMGGPSIYLGKLPQAAHKHMFITEEMFQIRHNILLESLREAGVAENLIEKWIKIDGAFKNQIVKSKIEDCEKRFKNDEVLVFDRSGRKQAA